VSESGRGRSVWDTFCETPDRVVSGHTGAVACDHYHHYYHRYAEDVGLMRDLGVGARQIGTANNQGPIWPADQTPGDREAAQRASDLINWLFADPALAGSYPESMHPLLPAGFADDLPTIATPLLLRRQLLRAGPGLRAVAGQPAAVRPR
jgi:beta-glucosidase/6-phospho-beta-glucosidase/beta-galactosidase